jgi:hypothetical protein
LLLAKEGQHENRSARFFVPPDRPQRLPQLTGVGHIKRANWEALSGGAG